MQSKTLLKFRKGIFYPKLVGQIVPCFSPVEAKRTLVFSGLCKRQTEKVLVPCVVYVKVARIVKIVQQIGGREAIQALGYLKAYLILPS